MFILIEDKLNCVPFFCVSSLLFGVTNFVVCKFLLRNKNSAGYELYILVSAINVFVNFVRGIVLNNSDIFIINFAVIPCVLSALIFSKKYNVGGGCFK